MGYRMHRKFMTFTINWVKKSAPAVRYGTLSFFCVGSLLNKPTVPKNGTHHTAAVERKQRSTLLSKKEPSFPLCSRGASPAAPAARAAFRRPRCLPEDWLACKALTTVPLPL